MAFSLHNWNVIPYKWDTIEFKIALQLLILSICWDYINAITYAT